jgi:alkanesulfonate monooxygenase SsuD/methylene tetrahydromethanopterin reductase-like flavin-dependent oxidoreductase (luciferase family)
VLIWSQFTTWPELMRAASVADGVGFDDIWSWDHLVPIKGDPDGPIFEAIVTVAGWAQVTTRARLGLMVAANTFRDPAVLLKTVTALDHLSGGRMVLGLGGGWFEEEHRRFGLPFGSGHGERLRWLDEAAAMLRTLLDGGTIAGPGDRYAPRDLANRPAPVQARMPLLIGGGGEQRTLQTVARYADMWNIGEDLEIARRKVEVLDAWCGRVDRDPREIERSMGLGPVILRERRREGRRVVEAMQIHNGHWSEPMDVLDSNELIDRLIPYLALGFRTFHIDAPAPFDVETLERFATEVIPALRAEAIGVGGRG